MATPARPFWGISIADLRPVNYLRITLLSWFAICLTLYSHPAFAQIKNRFAIGGEYKIRATDRASQEDYAHAKLGPGLLWRVGHRAEPEEGHECGRDECGCAWGQVTAIHVGTPS